jgi:uncharacterized protein (DUF58 family)
MLRFLPVLLLLIILAATMRDDFALTLVYLFIGAAAAGAWWSRKALAQIEPERKVGAHAFLDEKVQVRLQFRNRGWLPVLWLNIQDELPVGLSSDPSFSLITSLRPGELAHFDYTLDARKRGYYAIGPLVIGSGDILGLHAQQQRQKASQYLTVYPKIIPLSSVKLPSHSPHGTLRHRQPIFEDPTRIFSKRAYTSGDSLRRVDWKASATSGQLQVKQFEPSISLETFICLDLNAADYPQRSRIDASELAIVIAASLAAWITAQHQTVGLLVNGQDPLVSADLPASLPHPLPANKGQAHLMRILEVLARVEITENSDLTALVQRQRYHLPWGTTLIVITGQASQPLLDELFQARRAGQDTLLILSGPSAYDPELARRAAHYGIPLVCIANERELDIWRR